MSLIRRGKRTASAAAAPSTTRTTPTGDLPVSSSDVREFPDHPRVGVGGIVVHNGYVLLVRRGREPLKGQWSIPGGLVEVGEQLRKAVQREIKEETGLLIDPLQIVGVFERIERDPKPDTRVRYHYVIVDYVCRLRASRASDSNPPRLRPAGDVTEVEWVESEMLRTYGLSDEAEEVIIEAMQFVDPSW